MTKSGTKGDTEGSPWTTKGRTAKPPESSHMSREEMGVGGRHMPKMTNLEDNNPTLGELEADPLTPVSEELLENGKVKELVRKFEEKEATLGDLVQEPLVAQSESIEGM